MLLHPTSLPGRHGNGDLGPEAYRFVDFLVECGQRIWQVLPLGPTGYGDSPYQCFSAFAGNPLLISLEKLRDDGLLTAAEVDEAPAFPEDAVDFGWVIDFRQRLLHTASARFYQRGPGSHWDAYDAFCRDHAFWLEDYALFMAIKAAHGGGPWTSWEPEIARREPAALDAWRNRLGDEILAQRFMQFQFFTQWNALKAYCREHGIEVMGDTPIYVAHDSTDVWAHPELYHLDETGAPTVVAGVPPDYFSATGQLWGNPIYRWDVHAASGYQWWIERVRASLRMVDILRIDHFRGFEAYWEVPASEETAIEGRWVPGPNEGLFHAMQNALGPLPLVAENLGLITDEVEALRRRFEFPGMAVLQFAFGPDVKSAGFLPHEYYPDLVAYTGTHDNATTVGWWQDADHQTGVKTRDWARKTKAFARKYLDTTGRDINWVAIRTVMASVADTAVIPLQDLLGLGNEARMNAPGTTGGGNWRWRFRAGALTEAIAARLRDLTEIYGRLPE